MASVDSPSWTVTTTWGPSGPRACDSSSYQSVNARTRTSSAPPTAATTRRRRRTRAERAALRSVREGAPSSVSPVSASSAHSAAGTSGAARAAPRRRCRRARSPVIQPGLQQHHRRCAVDHLARRLPRAAGRPQGALGLHGGEALVHRLDRDPEGLEERRAAPRPPRAPPWPPGRPRPRGSAGGRRRAWTPPPRARHGPRPTGRAPGHRCARSSPTGSRWLRPLSLKATPMRRAPRSSAATRPRPRPEP